jgi:hypothetical protein
MAVRKSSDSTTHRYLIGRSISAYGLSAPIATSLIGGGPATIIWGYDQYLPADAASP